MTTSTNDLAYGLYVGVDIAATSAKVSWLMPGEAPSCAISMEQTPQAFSALKHRLLSRGHSAEHILVVMEATGSYWISLATTLTQAGFAVSVINPAQAHHFAKALLKRAKTDAIDAQTLAQLACLLHPTPWTPPPPVYAELQQRLAQHDSILELRKPGAQSTARTQPDALDHCHGAHPYGAAD
jgi:transposase